MAVDVEPSVASPRAGSSGRRVLVSTNVSVAIALAIAIVVVAQMMAFRSGLSWDMTSTGVNSLSPSTESLLRGIEQRIRLVSLYFETDRELPDQKRYRKTARDLIERFESVNRSRISSEWINPLKDNEKMRALLARLAEKPSFKDEIGAYAERIDAYRKGLDAQLQELVQSELKQISSIGSAFGKSAEAGSLVNVESLLMQWGGDLQRMRESVDAAMGDESPQYSMAVNELRNTYSTFQDALNNIVAYGRQELARSPSMPEGQRTFLSQAATRYAPVIAAIETENNKLQALEPLEFDKLVQQIGPRGLRNPLLVETDDTARVVEFAAMWPPVDPQDEGRGDIPFERRAFRGEEKLTAAILRITNKEQTAIVFVRYAGPSLFLGNPMQNGSPPYRQMKQHLEDANFVVQEWDLATSDTPPEIKPAPTRTIYVVLQPHGPPSPVPGMPPQGPQFGPKNLEAVKTAIGDDGRVLFIAGWQPGPGNLAASYQYRRYLQDTWGIDVNASALLIETVNTAPGQYNVVRRDFHSMRDVELSDHDIVRNLRDQRFAFPSCAYLDTLRKKEDVTYMPLVTQPAKDGVWAVYSLQAYGDQMVDRGYLTKLEHDKEGPFVLALAAQRGDAKVVVVSSRGFAVDGNAFAMAMVRTPSGFGIRHANPGNVALFVNSLHWLNDNTQFMNIGKPIDSAVLNVERSTVKKVQALTVFVWPFLALCCGGVVWWVRRR